MSKKKNFIELPQTALMLADPVQTPFGVMRWLTFREYMNMEEVLGRITLNTLHLYYAIKKSIPKNDKKALQEHESFKDFKIHEIVSVYPELQQAYIEVLLKMLDQNDFITDSDITLQVLSDIFNNEEAFNMARNYIMTMNLLQEEKTSPYQIVQDAFDRDKEFRKIKNKDAPTNSDIISTVGVSLSMLPQDVCELTPYQMHMYYARIAAIKDYDREILFSTVSSDREIESWAKKIDLFNIKDTSVIKKSEFDQKYGNMFGK